MNRREILECPVPELSSGVISYVYSRNTLPVIGDVLILSIHSLIPVRVRGFV